jgi:hypothetical protein
LKCRCDPFVRTSTHPSASMRRITSADFKTSVYYLSVVSHVQGVRLARGPEKAEALAFCPEDEAASVR